MMVNAICTAFQITEPHEMTMACDNISALWKSFDEEEPRQPDASSDILMAIRYQLKQSSLKWKGKWVKGHQDNDDKVTVLLDEWATESLFVDRIAGKYWLQMIKDLIPDDIPFWERMDVRRDLLRPASTKMQGENWQIKVEGVKN